MKIRSFIAVFVITAGGAAYAQQQQQPLRKTIRATQRFALAPGGTFVLENPIGNVDVAGTDGPDVEATIVTNFIAQNQQAMDEAVKNTGLQIGSDPRTRLVRMSIGAYAQKKPWSAEAHWVIRLPRNASVRILSTAIGRIRVNDVNGSVRVKNFNGAITLTNVHGAVVAESVNGSIVYSTPQPRGNVVLATLNGHVTASVAGNADFRWIAETATGDIRTNLPARGAFFGATFRGSVNAPGGPTLSTSSLMGNIHLLAAGSAATATQSIRRASVDMPASPKPTRVAQQGQSAAGGPRVYQQGTVKGAFTYSTTVGDVKVAQVRGDAVVTTGAGEVQLGGVSGTANVRSDGGPLHLGEILGVLNATTRAGDIFIDSTRRGGTISTQGGTIRLLYTGGPTRLTSGGGDIVVRQAAAPVNAETTSGDITITVDPVLKTSAMQAKTGKGNVILNVDPRFGADIDATIITSDPNADTFVSDIAGLTVNRSQVSGKTRVRATGKINGGGQRVVLQATDGDIRITTGRVAPTIVKSR